MVKITMALLQCVCVCVCMCVLAKKYIEYTQIMKNNQQNDIGKFLYLTQVTEAVAVISIPATSYYRFLGSTP